MPSPIEEQIRRKVIQQWFNGIPRDTIAEQNNIGAGTVSSIMLIIKLYLKIWILIQLDNYCIGKRAWLEFIRISFAFPAF